MFVFISVWCHYVWRPRALVVRCLSKSTDFILIFWFDFTYLLTYGPLTIRIHATLSLYLTCTCCDHKDRSGQVTDVHETSQYESETRRELSRPTWDRDLQNLQTKSWDRDDWEDYIPGIQYWFVGEVFVLPKMNKVQPVLYRKNLHL